MVREYVINDNLQLSENFRTKEFRCKCGGCNNAVVVSGKWNTVFGQVDQIKHPPLKRYKDKSCYK